MHACGGVLRSGSRGLPERWDRRPGGPRSTHRELHGSDRAGRNCAPSPSCSSASKPEKSEKQKERGSGPRGHRLGGGIRIPLHLHREVEWACFCSVLSGSCGLFFFVVLFCGLSFCCVRVFCCGLLFFVALLFSGLSVEWQLRVVLFCGLCVRLSFCCVRVFCCGLLFFVALLCLGLSVEWQLPVVLFCSWSSLLWLAVSCGCPGVVLWGGGWLQTNHAKGVACQLQTHTGLDLKIMSEVIAKSECAPQLP